MAKRISFKGYFEFYNNSLFYYPSSQDKIPHKTKVIGTWQLDKSHNLIFIIDESQNNVFGQSIKFDTKIEKATKSYLQFSLLRRITPTLRKITRIKLKGFWKLGSNHRLVFSAKRDPGYDELIFSNHWQVTKNNQIRYIYKRRFLKRKIVNSFTLKGVWKFKRNTLMYCIEDSPRSRLKLSISMGRKIAAFKKDRLEFTLGGSLEKDKRREEKRVSLWGRWRIGNSRLEFVFRGGRGRVWIFEVNKKLSKDKEITLKLIDKKGRPRGYRITVAKKIFRDGRLFLRGEYGREKRIQAGLYITF